MSTGSPGPGLDDPRCGSRKRDGSGDTCALPPGWGTDHVGIGKCRLHGGKTRTHQVAAQAEMVRQAVVTYGLPREVDPSQALLEEVHRTAGHVAWLGARVAQLPEGELFWGVTKEVDKPFFENGGGGLETERRAVPHVLVVQYDKERRHLAAVSKAAIDAGVSERVVSVFEQVASSYVAVLERVLSRLDLTEVQRARVPEVVTGELRAIAGGAG